MRTPTGPFGWLDARLLHDGWIERLGPEPISVLVFLALAANRQGVSYYGRHRMASVLALQPRVIDQALARLLDLGLVAHRPWKPGQQDGVWQLLPVPPPLRCAPAGTVHIGDILRQVRTQEFQPRASSQPDSRGLSPPPESGGK